VSEQRPAPIDPGVHHRHIAEVARLRPAAIRREMARVEGFDAKLAVLVTRGVGTMACAYVFAVLALVSLPAAISTHSTVVIVAWISQTFFQLVLLSIIMVGQRVQGLDSDARAARTFQDIEHIKDAIDTLRKASASA
jgi:hypothetical protein